MEVGESSFETPEASKETQLIIYDAAAQYRSLIKWSAARAGFRSETRHLATATIDVEDIATKGQAAIISGGKSSVYEEGAPTIPFELANGGVPVMGICFGAQLINHRRRGIVGKNLHEGRDGHQGEFGTTSITVDTNSVTFSGLKSRLRVLQSHNDSNLTLADGLTQIADSSGIIAAFEGENGRVVGLQFHPEVNAPLTAQ